MTLRILFGPQHNSSTDGIIFEGILNILKYSLYFFHRASSGF